MQTQKLPADFNLDDLMIIPVLMAKVSDEVNALVMIARKGGGLVVQFNGDKDRTFHIDIEHLANAAITTSLWLEKNPQMAKPVETPAPADAAAPAAPAAPAATPAATPAAEPAP
jgi:hypothetical protein